MGLNCVNFNVVMTLIQVIGQYSNVKSVQLIHSEVKEKEKHHLVKSLVINFLSFCVVMRNWGCERILSSDLAWCLSCHPLEPFQDDCLQSGLSCYLFFSWRAGLYSLHTQFCLSDCLIFLKGEAETLTHMRFKSYWSILQFENHRSGRYLTLMPPPFLLH